MTATSRVNETRWDDHKVRGSDREAGIVICGCVNCAMAMVQATKSRSLLITHPAVPDEGRDRGICCTCAPTCVQIRETVGRPPPHQIRPAEGPSARKRWEQSMGEKTCDPSCFFRNVS